MIYAIFGSTSLRSPEIIIERYIYHLPDISRPHFDKNCRPIDEKTHKIRPFPHLHTEIRPLGPTSPSFGSFMVHMHGYHPKTSYSASPQLGSSSRISESIIFARFQNSPYYGTWLWNWVAEWQVNRVWVVGLSGQRWLQYAGAFRKRG